MAIERVRIFKAHGSTGAASYCHFWQGTWSPWLLLKNIWQLLWGAKSSWSQQTSWDFVLNL